MTQQIGYVEFETAAPQLPERFTVLPGQGIEQHKGRTIGFKSAEIVIFTVNRFVALYGTNVPVRRPLVNRRFIASHNSFTILSAEEQLYSHVPDFCWLDPAGQARTDWQLLRELSQV